MDFSLILTLLALMCSWAASEKPRAFLLYPETAPTRLQFIGGIGIPVEDLAFESVTSGYVLKAEYFLPTKVEEVSTIYLHPQNVNRRSLNETIPNQIAQQHLEQQANDNNVINSSSASNNFQSPHKSAAAYRWIIYRAIEKALDRGGFPGHECLLRSICEHAALPLHYNSGMLAEIAHIVLTPTSSHDSLSQPSDKEFIEAEILGRDGGNCISTYDACHSSPLQQFTAILDLAET